MSDTAVKNVYEVMFLVNQSVAADLSSLIDHIGELFGRADADIVSLRKWDERRLAYPIEKQKRGVYFLAYAEMPGDGPAHLERDCVISEKIMRVLITKADHLTEEEMKTHDQRAELATEAKLKAEQGDAEGDRRSTVSVGAPVQEASQDASDTADDADDNDDQSDED